MFTDYQRVLGEHSGMTYKRKKGGTQKRVTMAQRERVERMSECRMHCGDVNVHG